MTLTRQHFKFLADEIATQRALIGHYSVEALAAFDAYVKHDLAAKLWAANLNFNTHKFLKDCGTAG